MSKLEELLVVVLVVILIAATGLVGIHHYGAVQYQSGYDAAILAGKARRDHDAEANRATEASLRRQLALKDQDANDKEIEHAQALEAAQRRVRSGTDRLRCPASPVQPAAASDDRPAAASLATDGAGPDIVPETAADILGYGAAIASLVRRYDDVVYRFEACRKVNAGP